MLRPEVSYYSNHWVPFLATYNNEGLLGSEGWPVRIIRECLPLTMSESDLSCMPTGRLILGIYTKAPGGLVMVHSPFLQYLEVCEYDFSLSRTHSAFSEWLASRRRALAKWERLSATANRVSGLYLFSYQVLLGDPSPSKSCQLCELQQFDRAK